MVAFSSQNMSVGTVKVTIPQWRFILGKKQHGTLLYLGLGRYNRNFEIFTFLSVST